MKVYFVEEFDNFEEVTNYKRDIELNPTYKRISSLFDSEHKAKEWCSKNNIDLKLTLMHRINTEIVE